MRLDAHQHFWKFDPVRDAWIDERMAPIRRDFLPDDLQPLLHAAGMDGCIAVQADPSEAETQFLLELAAANPFIKGIVGWVDLRAENVSERLGRHSKTPGLCGFRHIVQGEADDRFLLRPDFCRGIAALRKFGFTYDILVFPRHLPTVIEFVEKFPEQPFVMDHLAKPHVKAECQFTKKARKNTGWAHDIRAISRHENVHCKLSGLLTEADWAKWKPRDLAPYLEWALECFGPQRLMFGSDWPVCLLAGRYEDAVGAVENFLAKLSPGERAGIMGENAQRFYLSKTR